MRMSNDLSLDVPWSLGEEAFGAIVDELRAVDAKTFIEFGAGRSSVRFAQALSSMRVLSIESDPKFFPPTQALARAHGVDDRLSISLRPLTWQRQAGAPFWSYEPGDFPDVVDAVLIDGPPSWTGRGREAAFYQVVERVRLGGLIFLDDHRRRSEQQTVANWLVRFPACFDVRFLDVGHGVAVLRKRAETARPTTSAATAVDAWTAALLSVKRAAQRRMRSRG